MEHFEDKYATMTWEVWVNNHLGLRNPTFEFEDGELNDYFGDDEEELSGRHRAPEKRPTASRSPMGRSVLFAGGDQSRRAGRLAVMLYVRYPLCGLTAPR